MSQQQMPMPIVYPVYDTVPPSTHSSSGSYGSVFIVLAVIITVSVLACFLGRLCNKGRDVGKPSMQSLPPKQKDAKRNDNVFQTKDGDIEFGYDKRFASAKVAATSEPTMDRPDPFGKPNMVRPNSFHEPIMSRPNSFHEPSKVQPNSYPEPTTMGRPNSFHEPSKVQPNSYPEPTTMGRPDSFHKADQSQGDQVRFGADRDTQLNFKPRTRAQRY